MTTPRIFDTVKQNAAAICLMGWLIAAVGLLIRKVTVYQSFVKYIKAGRTEISDMQLWERVGKLVEQTGVKGAVGLYTNSLISSPLLIGFFRPSIMLPTTELSESDFENTILHELTHYKRRDMFYKWLVQVTICLHWFNPLVYLMGREVNRACELSCDEAVIRKRDKNGQRAYGDTLLNAMGMGGNYKDSIASVTLNEGKELLKERLDAIMKFKKTTRLTAAISVMLIFVFCFGAAAMGTYAASPPLAQDGTIKQDQLKTLSNDESFEDEEYSKWKIYKKDDTIYYVNERVRIFMDLREDNSFVNFNYDGLGTIDLRLVRGHNGDITKIEFISQTEAEEIRTDLDTAHSSLIKGDVSRLSKDMVSEKVLNAIESCDDGTWYVVVENGYQYIYYNGVPHNYAWQPEINQDSATIHIFDIGKSTSTYVLLKVPASLKLDVSYNATKIKYEIVNINANTDSKLHNIESTTTILNAEQEMTAIDFQATVGNLTVVYGDKPQIEIGPKLVNHASFSFDNGTFIYRDDFGKNNVSFNATNGEEYNINITIPNELQLKTLSVNVGIGSVDLQNVMAVNTKITGTTKINLNGFHSGTLDLNSTLADITATDISILQGLNLHSYGSTATVSGEIKGNVLIDSAGISNTNITFVNSDRKDYSIKSTWEPESPNEELGNLLLDNGLLIDGEKYSVEYSDTTSEAPYKLTVISRELMPMGNITINFAK